MPDMWDLGGLSIHELLKRTAKESWEDEVFGMSGRLAFYNFIALFPLLLLLMILLVRLASTGASMQVLLTRYFEQFLPRQAAVFVIGALGDLNARAHTGGLLAAVAAGSAVWAAVNASWAMIRGLNLAYETHEDRDWKQIIGAAAALALAVFVLVFAGLFAAHIVRISFGKAGLERIVLRIGEWVATLAILLISFALFYRFGPNLKDRRWQWSTPGAVFGAVLWIAVTLVFREYFDHFSRYPQIYGRAAAAAMLLMWLYVSSATILIGAEMNSEIEKAGEKRRTTAGLPAPARTISASAKNRDRLNHENHPG